MHSICSADLPARGHNYIGHNYRGHNSIRAADLPAHAHACVCVRAQVQVLEWFASVQVTLRHGTSPIDAPTAKAHGSAAKLSPAIVTTEPPKLATSVGATVVTTGPSNCHVHVFQGGCRRMRTRKRILARVYVHEVLACVRCIHT